MDYLQRIFRVQSLLTHTYNISGIRVLGMDYGWRSGISFPNQTGLVRSPESMHNAQHGHTKKKQA
jgi:hypothetical protein